MSLPEELFSFLEANGYMDLKTLSDGRVAGVYRYLFTGGVCYGLTEGGLEGRFCYPTLAEAREAISDWDGVGDPPGNWIKEKGRVERRNPNFDASRLRESEHDFRKVAVRRTYPT